ncbi:hypothetical protein ADUPG1_007388 [Aduncisulcus paluster]|uniref:Uncharacterized protein n=1 Tax=Aduncisulcus paluster TaxID=2918883 RepID=A0ABQ5KLX6_9EUKA|nr:hypothetical protein ADUPG1_007388 [Aduncisulcus paluster]
MDIHHEIDEFLENLSGLIPQSPDTLYTLLELETYIDATISGFDPVERIGSNVTLRVMKSFIDSMTAMCHLNHPEHFAQACRVLAKLAVPCCVNPAIICDILSPPSSPDLIIQTWASFSIRVASKRVTTEEIKEYFPSGFPDRYKCIRELLCAIANTCALDAACCGRVLDTESLHNLLTVALSTPFPEIHTAAVGFLCNSVSAHDIQSMALSELCYSLLHEVCPVVSTKDTISPLIETSRGCTEDDTSSDSYGGFGSGGYGEGGYGTGYDGGTSHDIMAYDPSIELASRGGGLEFSNIGTDRESYRIMEEDMLYYGQISDKLMDSDFSLIDGGSASSSFLTIELQRFPTYIPLLEVIVTLCANLSADKRIIAQIASTELPTLLNELQKSYTNVQDTWNKYYNQKYDEIYISKDPFDEKESSTSEEDHYSLATAKILSQYHQSSGPGSALPKLRFGKGSSSSSKSKFMQAREISESFADANTPLPPLLSGFCVDSFFSLLQDIAQAQTPLPGILFVKLRPHIECWLDLSSAIGSLFMCDAVALKALIRFLHVCCSCHDREQFWVDYGDILSRWMDDISHKEVDRMNSSPSLLFTFTDCDGKKISKKYEFTEPKDGFEWYFLPIDLDNVVLCEIEGKGRWNDEKSRHFYILSLMFTMPEETIAAERLSLLPWK